jgi:tetratricopeptide (TPR) repeat protein
MYSPSASTFGTQTVARRNAALFSGAETAAIERACLGGGIPQAAEEQLQLAGMSYQRDAVAEAHLREALQLAPEHPAVHIGLYRYYFYKGRLREALQVAQACLAKSARDIGLAADWRAVQPGDAAFGSYEAVLPRFYLFSLKACAYLHMRLGEVDEGSDTLAKLQQLDPGDKLGGSVLRRVLERMGLDDDD